MALTNRFGLTHFGAGVDGSLSSDGGKFTGRDRRVLDRILHAFETHAHDGGDRVLDPDFTPTLTLSTSGGSLRSGTTYYYAVTYVDRHGLETAPTDEVSVTTAGAVESPGAPGVEAVDGGTLPEGLHWYALTAFKDGNETALSPASAISISDWNTVNVTAPNGLPAGCDAVGVWRQGPLDSGFTRLVTVSVADPAAPPDPLFTDDGSIESVCGPGCIPGPELLPPTENLTNATNSVTVEIPAVDPAMELTAWRIYRTTQSGSYPASSLVAEVVETASELTGDLVNTYLDEGGEPMPGAPPSASQTLTPAGAHDDLTTGVHGVGASTVESAEGAQAKVDAHDADPDAHAAARGIIPINTQTASYTLALADAGKVIRMDSASALEVTVPAEATLDFPVGSVVNIRQIDADVTVVADAGVTVTVPAGRTLVVAGAGDEVSLQKIGADLWEAVGGFAAA